MCTPFGTQSVFFLSVFGSQCEKAGVPGVPGLCQNPYLFLWLGLAFERKADAPSYWKQIKTRETVGAIGSISQVCKAGVMCGIYGMTHLPVEQAHWLSLASAVTVHPCSVFEQLTTTAKTTQANGKGMRVLGLEGEKRTG
jgi:hypothetical protein